MKLSQWAKQNTITYLTAYRWFKAGKIPNAYQSVTGSIIIKEPDRCVMVIIGEKDKIKKIQEEILGIGLTSFMSDI